MTGSTWGLSWGLAWGDSWGALEVTYGGSPRGAAARRRARPQAWAICQRLMDAQQYGGPVRWIVVDDGPEPQPIAFQRADWSLELVRPRPCWQPGPMTLTPATTI